MDAQTFRAAVGDNFCPQFDFGVDFGVDFGDDDFGDDAIVPTAEDVRPLPIAPPPRPAPTMSRAPEVNVDEEIHQFVINQKVKSTTYKDTTSTNRLHSFLKEIDPTDGRQFWELNHVELDKIICLFLCGRKRLTKTLSKMAVATCTSPIRLMVSETRGKEC